MLPDNDDDDSHFVPCIQGELSIFEKTTLVAVATSWIIMISYYVWGP